jgi:hypothetical protein
MMPSAAFRALLEQSIDYAGTFPPCSLELEPALRNQAQYVRDPDAWMLGTFVLAMGKFDAAAGNLSLFDREHPLLISALEAKTANADEFSNTLKIAAEKIRSFSAEHVDLVSARQLEMPLSQDVDLGSLAKARSVLEGLKLQAFWETPVDSAEETIALLAEHNSTTGAAQFGYKLRTGGVTADAFPASQQIARALVAAAKQRVPIKFTAGLHHPIRQFRDEVKTKMHGFLNVLGAAVLAAEHQWDEQQTSKMLEDENGTSFSFSDALFAWGKWKIATDQIKTRRKLVTSFGSCSFDEPREDLRALNLPTS